MTMIDPAYPFAATVDFDITLAQRLSLPQLARQAQLSYPGDPMVGQSLPGTSIPYVKATQVQQYIWLWYMESGTKFPDNYQAIIDANAGPALPWNFSYVQWGLAAQ